MRRLRRLPKPASRAPLAIAGFIAIPLFFSSLMASALAQEKPDVAQWKGCAALCTTWHDPTAANAARVWLWAFVPSLVLVAVGWLACRVRHVGFYVPCLTAVVLAMAVVHKTATWERHHTARFPWGVDLIPGTASYAQSNKWDPGQWEKMARETSLSLQHWTIAIALVAAAVMAGLWVRQRYFGRRPSLLGEGPLEGIHAPDATLPSVPVE
jgi:hypothetical protein